MHAGKKAIILLLPALLAPAMISTAVAEINPRLAPAAEIYAQKSKEILKKDALEKLRIKEQYLDELRADLYNLLVQQGKKMEEDPVQYIRVPDGRGAYKKIEVKNRPRKQPSPEVATLKPLQEVRRQVANGEAVAAPTGLNNRQLSRHNRYLDSIRAVQDTTQSNKKRLDRQYLAALDRLIAEAGENPELISHLEKEKTQINSAPPCPFKDL